MSSILVHIQGGDVRRFEAGQVILEQGTNTGLLLFLIEGAVEVMKDGVRVAIASQPGAVFGELAALLGGNHTATVRALSPTSVRVVENPRAFLESSPLVCMHVCELVARRLDSLNHYLVDVKRQFADHDHISMVDGVLEALMHRQPTKRVRSGESISGESELAK